MDASASVSSGGNIAGSQRVDFTVHNADEHRTALRAPRTCRSAARPAPWHSPAPVLAHRTHPAARRRCHVSGTGSGVDQLQMLSAVLLAATPPLTVAVPHIVCVCMQKNRRRQQQTQREPLRVGSQFGTVSEQHAWTARTLPSTASQVRAMFRMVSALAMRSLQSCIVWISIEWSIICSLGIARQL